MKQLLCFFGVCIGRPHPDAKVHAELAALSPHVRGPDNQARLNRWRLYALCIVVVAGIFNVGLQVQGKELHAGLSDFALSGLLHVLPILAVAYGVGVLWEGLFAHFRGRSREPGLLATALLFTALMPPAAPLWHVALGMSFAIVFAQEVFGGHGKTFLPPALVGAAVLQVSFPSAMAGDPLWSMLSGYGGTTAFSLYVQQGLGGFTAAGIDVFGAAFGSVQGTIGASGIVANLIAASVLLAGGAANWRAMAGVLLGIVVAAVLSGGDLNWYWHLLLGGAVFGAVFLATDLAGSASTQAGRWLQGGLAGVLVVLIRVYNPGHPDGVVPAFLFAAIMAPLIDAIVVRVQVRMAKARARKRRAAL
ncbi:MAG TPA: RnfABCDGE type electron transport complex subunit D [Magnetovibrio sp.]